MSVEVEGIGAMLVEEKLVVTSDMVSVVVELIRRDGAILVLFGGTLKTAAGSRCHCLGPAPWRKKKMVERIINGDNQVEEQQIWSLPIETVRKLKTVLPCIF